LFNLESDAIRGRIGNALENIDNKFLQRPFDDQLLMLYAIGELSNSPLSICKKPTFNGAIDEAHMDAIDRWTHCLDLEKPILLKKLLEKDTYYKKQCHLQ